jgi:hypothetical protein
VGRILVMENNPRSNQPPRQVQVCGGVAQRLTHEAGCSLPANQPPHSHLRPATTLVLLPSVGG